MSVPRASDQRLLAHLRETAGLTASKPVCTGGDCGACLVLIGEIEPGASEPRYRTANSCLLTTSMVEGCHVVTAEGLNGEALTGALLAGTPFMDAAAGNLCRCTGYAGIKRACATLVAVRSALPR